MKTKKAFRLLRSRSCGCSYVILMWLKEVHFTFLFEVKRSDLCFSLTIYWC
ncbi:hypothetical protein HanXRQr2_Chr09g0393761 [Helianthus annuus]|uniref:Uncharacterized protein n=1 Tax=Helianthus annuus TaxID=4232 RepID=A0A9K3I6W7_HELAN|nr:hypothetical protein HanXRQr2_Chr09g0393761 [Helianthus annuus]